MSTILRNLKAKLDRAALDQLRAHCAQQAALIDQLRDELANAERRADWADQYAERRADWADQYAEEWADDFRRLEASLEANQAIGMTQDGALHLISTEVTA